MAKLTKKKAANVGVKNGILGQQFVTLTESPKHIPGNPHINSVRRWAYDGVGGTRLETWKVGGTVVTSIEAIERFILARSGQSKPTQPKGATRAHQAAEARLDELGVK